MLKRCLATLLMLLFASTSQVLLAAKTQVYGEDQTKITVKSTNPVFTIKLKSTPSTGYAWFLEEYNLELIKMLNHGYITPDTKLIGASGYEEWIFEVKPKSFETSKTIELRFVYVRPWNRQDTDKEIVFKVSTKK